MNENEDKPSGFFASVAKDEGVHRAVAGVVVALVIAGTKRALFSST
jgi:hypothetical protein